MPINRRGPKRVPSVTACPTIYQLQVHIANRIQLQHHAGSCCLRHALAAPWQSPFAAWQDSEKTQFDDEAERRRELHRERADEQAERLRDAYNQLKYTAQDKVRHPQHVCNCDAEMTAMASSGSGCCQQRVCMLCEVIHTVGFQAAFKSHAGLSDHSARARAGARHAGAGYAAHADADCLSYW